MSKARARLDHKIAKLGKARVWNVRDDPDFVLKSLNKAWARLDQSLGSAWLRAYFWQQSSALTCSFKISKRSSLLGSGNSRLGPTLLQSIHRCMELEVQIPFGYYRRTLEYRIEIPRYLLLETCPIGFLYCAFPKKCTQLKRNLCNCKNTLNIFLYKISQHLKNRERNLTSPFNQIMPYITHILCNWNASKIYIKSILTRQFAGMLM